MFNHKSLAMRDPAMAALMGAIGGADFGAEGQAEEVGESYEEDFGEALDSQFGNDGFFGDDFGADNFFGTDFGDDFGSDFGGGFFAADPAPTAMAKPTPAAAVKAWQTMQKAQRVTAGRKRLLNPNAGSLMKIERYQLNVQQTFTLGTATALNMTKAPDTELRAQRVVCNAPSPAFAMFSELKVANVSVTQGDMADGFFWNANGWGVQLDLPTISPANRVTALGVTTTLVPPGFVAGVSFPLTLSFMGPASMAA